MRIILTQDEMEIAVKNYIHSQITVREGQDINMEFNQVGSSFSVEVNIVSKVTTEGNRVVGKATQAAQEAQQSKPPVQSATVPDKAPTPTVAPAVAPTPTTPAQVAPSAPVASTTTEAPTPATVTPEKPVNALFSLPAASDKPTNPEVSKSLFANLAKPVNPKPPAEA